MEGRGEMDNTGRNVFFSEPAPLSVDVLVNIGNTPIAFMDRNRRVGDGLNLCHRRSGDSVLGAANAERCVNVVKSSKFGPVSRVEAVGFLFAEEETAGIGVRLRRPTV